MTCAVCCQQHQRGTSASGRPALYCSKRCANVATERRRGARTRAVVEDGPDLTPWHEVGAALGVSGRRACQIADQAMAKLRLLAATEELR